jgi:WD40 repeat protein
VDKGKELHRFEGHSGLIHDVAFSPDGKKAASVSEDRTGIIYDVEKGTELHRLKGHMDRVTCVAFAPRGDTLVTGGWDNTVRLWSAETGKEVKQFTGHTGWVQAVAFSPDGSRFLTGSGGGMRGPSYVAQGDNSVRLWDVASGKELQRISNADWGGIACAAFLPDGRHILFSEWRPFRQDRFLFLWDTQTQKELARYQDPADWAPVVRVASDGKLVLIARSFRADNAAQVLRLPAYGEVK